MIASGDRRGSPHNQANRQHPIYPDIRNLVLKTSALLEILRQGLHDTDVRVAFVFGSLASCAEQAHSDVDLMILSSVGLRKVGPLLADAAELLGREVNPHIMNPDEFARKRAMGDHFNSNVLNSPRLFVLGSDDDLGRLTPSRHTRVD